MADPVVILRTAGARRAIRMEAVIEVVRMIALLDVPNGPPWMLGIADRHGDLVPVLDLSLHSGGAPTTIGLQTRIAFCEVDGRIVGLAADDAEAVLEAEIVDAPGSQPIGVVRIGDDRVVLVDLCELAVM